MGHKGPVFRPRCNRPRRAQTQILFNSIQFDLNWILSCNPYVVMFVCLGCTRRLCVELCTWGLCVELCTWGLCVELCSLVVHFRQIRHNIRVPGQDPIWITEQQMIVEQGTNWKGDNFYTTTNYTINVMTICNHKQIILSFYNNILNTINFN